MSLTITDETLAAMKLDERQARVEIACRFFDAELLGSFQASRLAGLSRGEFEEELIKRNLPVIHINEKYWQQELESLHRSEQQEQDPR